MNEKTQDIYTAPALAKPWKAWIYFMIGVVPVIGFRLVTIAQHYSDIWAKLVWYTAVVSSFVFFWLRYNISCRRYKAITVRELVDKVDKKVPLDEHDYKTLHYILSSLIISKERLNYLLIFIASFVSIAIAIYLDFFR